MYNIGIQRISIRAVKEMIVKISSSLGLEMQLRTQPSIRCKITTEFPFGSLFNPKESACV